MCVMTLTLRKDVVTETDNFWEEVSKSPDSTINFPHKTITFCLQMSLQDSISYSLLFKHPNIHRSTLMPQKNLVTSMTLTWWKWQTASLRWFLSFHTWNDKVKHIVFVWNPPCVWGIKWTEITDCCRSGWVFDLGLVVTQFLPFSNSPYKEDRRNWGERCEIWLL